MLTGRRAAEPHTAPRSAAAVVWSVPHLQLWLLPSLPISAATLLLIGGALGCLLAVGVLVATFYLLTEPSPTPRLAAAGAEAKREAAGAASMQGEQDRPPPPASVTAGTASFGPLLRTRERFSGPVWTVLPVDWQPTGAARQQSWDATGGGAAAGAPPMLQHSQWSARLRGSVLRLAPASTGFAAGNPASKGQPPGKVQVRLADCHVRAVDACPAVRGPWGAGAPLEIASGAGQHLLDGFSRFYLFAQDGEDNFSRTTYCCDRCPSLAVILVWNCSVAVHNVPQAHAPTPRPAGAAREQWLAALLCASGGARGPVARLDAAYSDFCGRSRQLLLSARGAEAERDDQGGGGPADWPRLSRRTLMRGRSGARGSRVGAGGLASLPSLRRRLRATTGDTVASAARCKPVLFVCTLGG